jgi:hypothetical protein
MVVLAGVLSALSHQALASDAHRWMPYILFAWLTIGALTLMSLLWLYVQIAVGPRATVGEDEIEKLETQLARLHAGKGLFRKSRIQRLSQKAQALTNLIDPPKEARNVYLRRIRLTNAVLALVAVLSMSFWIFATLAPQLWPANPWFADGQAPPNPLNAALFSVDQVTRGTIFDLVDVYDLKFSTLRNNPHNLWFSSAVMVYRLFVGAALVAALAVRLGMREDWREKAAREAAEGTKARLARLAAGS